MPTYAVVADIENEFRKITFDTTSDITDTRVQGFLDEAEAEINNCLDVVYVTPITGTKSKLIVKRIEIAIVAARIASIIDLKQNTQSKIIKQEFNKQNFADAARKQLQDLKSRIITLDDAVLLNSDFGMSSQVDDDNVVPVFDKCLEQW